MTVAGLEVVGYVCEHCSKVWSRAIENDLDVHDIVRVDLPHATLYGDVRQVDGDRVQVHVSDHDRLLWVERWRVIVY
ncbi:hypothetical protein ACWCQK_26425 [Streptomyces sp. NPDC002306]